MKKQTDLTVANEILRQLGGRQFIAMTGVKNLVGEENSLTMTLPTNQAKAKWLEIKLTADDTYTFTYYRMKRTLDKEFFELTGQKFYKERLETIKTVEGLYFDMIVEEFERTTGFYTKLV